MPQLITDAGELGQPFRFRSGKRGRIIEAVMQPIGRAEEYRAGFTGIVAHRNYGVEMLSRELIDVL